jgi:hypothetical protein
MTDKKIILLHDIIETKIRKEKELEFYQKQLEELQNKMFFLKKEIDLTNLIMDIIEKESVVDIRERLIEVKDED